MDTRQPYSIYTCIPDWKVCKMCGGVFPDRYTWTLQECPKCAGDFSPALNKLSSLASTVYTTDYYYTSIFIVRKSTEKYSWDYMGLYSWEYFKIILIYAITIFPWWTCIHVYKVN